MNISKILNVTLYFLQKLGPISKTKMMKLLFFADFLHVKKYNKPITWAAYYRLPKGPAPSYFLDIINSVINKIPNVQEDDIERFCKVIQMKRNLFNIEGYYLCPIKKPDMDELSESDKEVIDEIIIEYGHKNAGQLWRFTHKHPAWKINKKDKIVWYSNIFPEGEKRESLRIWEENLDDLREISPNISL